MAPTLRAIKWKYQKTRFASSDLAQLISIFDQPKAEIFTNTLSDQVTRYWGGFSTSVRDTSQPMGHGNRK